MDKKGFTLIELLAVIIVLSIVMLIAVPSIGGIYKSIQNSMLNEKTTIIEEAAILFGEDIKGIIMSSNTKYNGNKCKSFIVSDLVPEYLSKDNEEACLESDSLSNAGCIIDPRNKDNYLDKYEVIIYYKNRRIKAVVDTDNTLICS